MRVRAAVVEAEAAEEEVVADFAVGGAATTLKAREAAII